MNYLKNIAFGASITTLIWGTSSGQSDQVKYDATGNPEVVYTAQNSEKTRSVEGKDIGNTPDEFRGRGKESQNKTCPIKIIPGFQTDTSEKLRAKLEAFTKALKKELNSQ